MIFIPSLVTTTNATTILELVLFVGRVGFTFLENE